MKIRRLVPASLTLLLALPVWAQESASDTKAATEEADKAKADADKRATASQEVAEQGEAELQKSVRVFQQRYLVKAGRAELLLGGTSSFNDPMIHHLGADAALLFHLSERFALGVGGTKWWGSPRNTFNNIQGDYGLFPEKSQLQAGGWAEVQYSPVVGKFTSFGVAVLQLDAYALLAGGAVRTTRGESLKGAGAWGLGLRVHTLRWLTLAFEMRNLLFLENYLPREGVVEDANKELMKHWFGGIRLGIWIPPTVNYRYQR